MRQHMPGPWEAVERIDGRWEVRGDHADSAEGIPVLPGTEYDARMMALAPEMLRLLEEFDRHVYGAITEEGLAIIREIRERIGTP